MTTIAHLLVVLGVVVIKRPSKRHVYTRNRFPYSLLVAIAAGVGMAGSSNAAVAASSEAPWVLICGTGASPHYETMTDQFIDLLTENKVKVTNTDQHEFGRSTCMEKAKAAGAQSLMYVTTSVSERLAYETNVSVQCLTVDGTKVWEESQKGPLMSMSVNSTISKIVDKMKEKLKAHIGQPCLLVS